MDMLRGDEPATTRINGEGWFDNGVISGLDHGDAANEGREGKERRGN